MADAKVVGSIQLEIVDDDLKAVASYYPDSDGIAWDAQKLRSLLAGEGVVFGFDPGSMDEILARFAGADDEMTAVVAEGTPVELPIPEEAMWEELPIPPDLQKDAETAFLHADPPEKIPGIGDALALHHMVVRHPYLAAGEGRHPTELCSLLQNHGFQAFVVRHDGAGKPPDAGADRNEIDLQVPCFGFFRHVCLLTSSTSSMSQGYWSFLNRWSDSRGVPCGALPG